MRGRYAGSLLAVTAAALVACGGGGGSSTPFVTLMSITPANQEAVSHAAAAGAMSLGATGAVPLSPQSVSAGDTRTILSAGLVGRGTWTAHVIAALTHGLGARSSVLRADMKRPLADIDLGTESCPSGGTISIMLHDNDNNGDASVGDTVDFVFNACRDTPDETIDGSLFGTVLAFNSDGTALTGDFEFKQLSAATSTHSIKVDGTVRLVYSTPSVTSSIENLDLTARGPVTGTVSTHLPYNDTVTLKDGWHEVSRYDGSVAPVVGNVEYGQSTLSVSGYMSSATAGGTFKVSTATDIVSYGEDTYPRQGALLIEGEQSALRLTALSPSSVQIELDANGDGSWESKTTQDWDWLF
jgi:hypothetical protein